jgi:large subunit ribosomal protein L21
MYAVIETGGKQYRVAEGDVITVEKLAAEPGETVQFDKVLLVEKDGQLSVGQPLVAGAKAVAKVLAQGKEKKILVFHYRAKKNERKRYGHRQPYTRVLVEKIEA